MKKYFLFFSTLICMTLMAQEQPILLFPDGAPGETVKLFKRMYGMETKWPVVRYFGLAM